MKFFHIQILCLFTTLFSCQSEDIDSELKFNEASATPVNCVIFFPRDEDNQHPEKGLNCGKIDETGLVKYSPKFLELEPFISQESPGCVALNQGQSWQDGKSLGWFFITAQGYGRGHKEHHDNGCERWEELPNLAKTYVEGKLAYMDKTMAIIHQSEFVFGEEFQNGLAVVCSELPHKRLGPYKEHFAYLGGKCGEIDLDFQVVTTVQQSIEEISPLPEWAIPRYVRRSNLLAQAGQGENLERILKDALKDIPGLRRADISRNIHNTDLIFVSETWESREAHTASLDIPEVREAITKGRPLISSFEHQSEYEYDPENGKY